MNRRNNLCQQPPGSKRQAGAALTVTFLVAVSPDGRRVCDAFELLSYFRRKSRGRRADTPDLTSRAHLDGNHRQY
jgi:hypothetical protein